MNPAKTVEILIASDFSIDEAKSLARLGNRLADWYKRWNRGQISRDICGLPYFCQSKKPIRDHELESLILVDQILEARNSRSGKYRLTPKIFNDENGFSFYLISSWEDLILIAFL